MWNAWLPPASPRERGGVQAHEARENGTFQPRCHTSHIIPGHRYRDIRLLRPVFYSLAKAGSLSTNHPPLLETTVISSRESNPSSPERKPRVPSCRGHKCRKTPIVTDPCNTKDTRKTKEKTAADQFRNRDQDRHTLAKCEDIS